MGDAGRELEPIHIKQTIRLMYGASLLAGAMTALLAWARYGLWS